MSKPWVNQVTMAASLKAKLKADGWSTFEEVRFARRCADLVATRRRSVDVYECSVAYNRTVMTQAHRWLGHAHRSWVAIGVAPRQLVRVIEQCSENRVGLILVSPADVSVLAPAPTQRIHLARHPELRGPLLMDQLQPEHASGRFAPAGSKPGNRVSLQLDPCRWRRWFTNHPRAPLVALEAELAFLESAHRLVDLLRDYPDVSAERRALIKARGVLKQRNPERFGALRSYLEENVLDAAITLGYSGLSLSKIWQHADLLELPSDFEHRVTVGQRAHSLPRKLLRVRLSQQRPGSRRGGEAVSLADHMLTRRWKRHTLARKRSKAAWSLRQSMQELREQVLALRSELLATQSKEPGGTT